MAWRSWRARFVHLPGRVTPLGALSLVALMTFNVANAEHPRVPVRATPRHAQSHHDPALSTPGPPPEQPSVADTAVQLPWDSSRIDSTTLADRGVVLPAGANVFAARVLDGVPTPAYLLYEAGGGAFASGFHPASSIKVLAALGALELAYDSGFTGGAVVDGVYSLSEYYDAAIRYSSNEDYDALVRIAGVAWLNEQFLPSRGYSATRIQQAYAGGRGVADSPPVHLTEEGGELTLPERVGNDDYGCAAANCSTLFELVDSVRRVVLNDELPVQERFEIAPADVTRLQDALLAVDSWIGPGVADALGPGALVYSKPGWTSGFDCVDVALVVHPETGRRYLLGVSAPDDGECAMLATMAADVLTVLAHDEHGGYRAPRP